VQASREALAYAVLRAPFAGVVAEQPVHVGDVVAPGAPLIVIEGEGGWEVVASLSRAQAAAVRVKGVVPVEVDGIAQPLSAVVRVLSPAGDPATHRFELRADLPAAPAVRSGLFARVAVPGVEEAEERLMVPASAVLDRGGLSGLYVVSDGRARLRWVALGSRAGDVVEVRAGAEAGERVVLEPAGLADGARVSER
jgi:RND family efflux transporter MFP subunit